MPDFQCRRVDLAFSNVNPRAAALAGALADRLDGENVSRHVPAGWRRLAGASIRRIE
jgi:hypothetical protein